ncbi:MAG: alginate O-acetyltransferase AlgX-related protein [bacterium]
MLGYAALLAAIAGSERRYRAIANGNILLALACTAVALLACEWAARVITRDRVRTFPRSVVTRTATSEYDVEMKTNRDGFRDAEHERAKPAGTVRLAVLGDSFVVGSGVAFESIFTSRLAAAIARRDSIAAAAASDDEPRIEVLNFGVSGTGPLHAARVWRRFASAYDPDVVLVCVYAGNDASDALREASETPPRFALAALAGEAVARWRPVRGAGAGAGAGAGDGAASGGWNAFGGENPASLDALLRAARERGVSETEVRARLAAIPEPLVADALAFRSNPFNLAEAVLDPEAMIENLLLEGDTMERGWRATEDALGALHDEIARTGATMVLVGIPAGVQVSERYWWATHLGLVLDRRILVRAPFQDRLAKFAAREGVALVDLLPTLRSAGGDSGAPLYFEQDGHWNARGHEVAAHLIAAALRAGGVAGASRSAGR